MTYETFDQLVEDALQAIPDEFSRLLDTEGIDIIARDVVPQRVHELFPNQIVFGLFTGVPRNQRNTFSIQIEPTRIEIYQESFERAFGSIPTPRFRDQVVKTVIHEIAHYMGFNEEEVRERGY